MNTAKLAGAICLVALTLPAQQKVDKAVLDRWMQELSNWGRWGSPIRWAR